MVVEVQDVVGVSPKDFGKPLQEVVINNLKSQYEGTIDEELGYVILVAEAHVDPVGYLLPRDGSTYHRCTFKLITYLPKSQEVVLGEVVEITEFGCFVRVGPLDGLLHISQITDDYISYDEKHNMLMGKKTGRKLTVGDDVRARIVVVSLSSGTSGKIGLTTRQPMLGKLEWIEEEKQKAVEPV
ncbi:MAG: DNA-directed RNA polymerase [Aigarchaeota archaeon]|nr:DNA-directed RNA polymerase [Candidatus Pelearchaeum maunauluense]